MQFSNSYPEYDLQYWILDIHRQQQNVYWQKTKNYSIPWILIIRHHVNVFSLVFVFSLFWCLNRKQLRNSANYKYLRKKYHQTKCILNLLYTHVNSTSTTKSSKHKKMWVYKDIQNSWSCNLERLLIYSRWGYETHWRFQLSKH